MPGQKVKIGPWPAGLNQRDDPRMIEDKELATCLNYDVTNEGTLRTRRPCRVATALPAGQKFLMGSINRANSLWAVVSIYSDGNSIFRYTDNPTGAWSEGFQSNPRPGRFKAVISYNSAVWVIPGNSDAVGFQHDMLGILAPVVDVPEMPWGDYAFMLKDRMFIVRKSTNRIYYSKATDPTVWAAPDGGFFDVNPGDGQEITKVVVTANQVVIFKRDATYIFQFSEDPALDGGLRQVSSDQGAFDAIVFNNEVYCVNARSVFKFLNGYFVDVGSKIDLFSDSTLDRAFDPGCRLSVVNKTLLLGRTYSTRRAQDAWYAMNLDTGAWSEHFYPAPNASPSTASIIIRSAAGSFTLFGDGVTGALSYMNNDLSEEHLDLDTDGSYYPTYEFTTKSMTFGDNEDWKRLFAWAFESQALPEHQYLIDPTPVSRVVVDDIAKVPASADHIDRINTVSTRFRRVQFQYNAHKPDGSLVAIDKFADGATKVAPKFYSITAWVSTNSPVVT